MEFSIDEFGKESSSAQRREDQCNAPAITPADVDYTSDVKEILENGLVQYTKFGTGYTPSGKTQLQLPSGVYTIGVLDTGMPIYDPVHIKSDDWLTFKDGLVKTIVDEIDVFWKSSEIFDEYGFMQKRGYMLYGPPGTGKTILVKQLMKKIVEAGGIVFICDGSPGVFSRGLKFFSQLENQRNSISIFEDIDALIEKYGETDILSLLDGEDSINHTLNIATTNYPEKLDRRIIGRPRRFDRIIKIGYPEEDVRIAYFAHKLKLDPADPVVVEWAKETEDLTFAAMTELVISVKCLGNTFEDTIKRIRELVKLKPKSDDFSGDRVGFGV